ncbi:ATP-binding cassette domain-containing protein [Streptomyces sp. NPDC051963]|uniref:ABC transporter ATP-binding protein n=1 Tax=Streptomyces sp. NPDC051963 TaxID=3365678 RepID=UPI0037D0A3AB
MIEVFGLTSNPRKELPPAVDDVTFEARAGHVTALLGAPGAGKTTALKLMLELQQGRGITYFRGRPLHRIAHPSREVGVLLGDVPGHPARTVRGHLRMLCAAAGVSVRRADEVLEVVGLVSLREERLGTLSRGLDRRLGLACALISDPHTLVLDDPTEGLSARESHWLYGMLRAHASQGGTVLHTTADPKEAARTADRVITLERGSLVADQEAAEFARTRLRPRVAVRSPHAVRLAALLTKEARAAQRSLEVVREGGNRLSVYGSTCADVGETAFRHGILVHQLADEIGDMGPGTTAVRTEEPQADGDRCQAAEGRAPDVPRQPDEPPASGERPLDAADASRAQADALPISSETRREPLDVSKNAVGAPRAPLDASQKPTDPPRAQLEAPRNSSDEPRAPLDAAPHAADASPAAVDAPQDASVCREASRARADASQGSSGGSRASLDAAPDAADAPTAAVDGPEGGSVCREASRARADASQGSSGGSRASLDAAPDAADAPTAALDATQDASAHLEATQAQADGPRVEPGTPLRANVSDDARVVASPPQAPSRRPVEARGLGALSPLPPPISVRPSPSPLRPLRYELRRATGIGTGFLTGAVVLVVSAFTAVLLARIGHTPQPRLLAAWPQELPLPPAALGAGLLGALAFGDEFRHPALAADRGTVPRRLGLLSAKLLVTAATGLLLAFLTVGCNAEALYLVYGRELAQVPADWLPLSASWLGLVIGCAWAGVLAAGIFRSTTAGLAAVVAVPILVVPLVHRALEGPAVRTAAGFPMRLREVLLMQWPFGGERYLAVAARMVAQPVGGALALSLSVLLCAYLLTTLRSRVR